MQAGKAGLNKHRQSLLDKVPEQNQWARFEFGSLEMEDLAYLTAKTGHEFTILLHRRFLFVVNLSSGVIKG